MLDCSGGSEKCRALVPRTMEENPLWITSPFNISPVSSVGKAESTGFPFCIDVVRYADAPIKCEI